MLTVAGDTDVVPADRLRALRASVLWSDHDVTGLPVEDAQLLSVGGGLASFALVDLLRVAGVPASDVAVVGPWSSPADGFRHLASAAQISAGDRLRSDSAARPDNPWGFPGYALTEARARRSWRPVARVLAEPVAAEYYTPTSGQVYAAVEREASRIGWPQMIRPGWTELVRPRREGGFFALVIRDNICCSVLRTRFVHLGLGYPALRVSADLQRYRTQHGDGFSAVAAYEPHEHIYRTLAHHGGTVVVRGAGITASRVIERLLAEDVHSGDRIRVIHLVSRAVPGCGRRAAGWRYQPFNFPRAATGGQLAAQLDRADDADRAVLLARYGATSTPHRRSWQSVLRRGTARGAYRLLQAGAVELFPAAGHRLRVRITDPGWSGMHVDLEADFLIDATGLAGDVSGHPLLADLINAGLARPNELGGLQVDENFEIRQARNGSARAYATGRPALGSRIGPVDSFWGVHAAALAVADDLARIGFGERIGVRRSVNGWWRWARGRAP